MPETFAVLAAMLIGCAAVLQQRAAGSAPVEKGVHPRLLVKLARHPLWLAGVLTMVGGYVLQALALGFGKLLIVEPLLVTSLVFALCLSLVLGARGMRLKDWIAAVATVAALGAFLTIGKPHGGVPRPTFSHWMVPLAVVGFVLLVSIAGAPRLLPRRPRATALAVLAGSFYGMADGLVKSVVSLIDAQQLAVVEHWQLYALLATGTAAFLLQQTAYHLAPISTSQPSLSALEPVVGSLLGVVVYGEHLSTAALPLTIELASAVIMIAGVITLARSPLVSRTDVIPLTTAAVDRSPLAREHLDDTAGASKDSAGSIEDPDHLKA